MKKQDEHQTNQVEYEAIKTVETKQLDKKQSASFQKYSWRVFSNFVHNTGLMVWLVGVYLAINFVIGALARWQQKIWPISEKQQLLYLQLLHFVIFGSTLLALYVVPKLIFAKKSKLRPVVEFKPQELGLTGWLKWRDIGLGVSGFVLAFVFRIMIIMSIKQYFPEFNIEEKQDLGFQFGWYNSRLELAAVFFTLVVLAPVVEEIIFRGYLFSKIRSRSNFLMTTLLVSVLFGLAHFFGGGWVAVVVTFSLSLVMCLTREVSKSLYPAMIIHAINNFLAFLVILSGLR